MVKFRLIFCLLLCSFGGFGQNIGKYLVYFKDKTGSTYSTTKPAEFLSAKAIERRKNQGISITTNDLPPNKNYISEVIKTGAKVWYTSRWLNGALVLADSVTANKIKALSFVKGFEADGPLNLASAKSFGRKKNKFETVVDTANYGNSNTQNRMLGTHNLHNAGYKGNGMTIAILDDGFGDVNKDKYMAKVFTEKRVLGTFDFVRNTKSVYDVGDHGNVVMSTIAANVPGEFVGTAPEASFVLLRSEDAPTEKLIEEANYLFACEYADSAGVDVINTSLGYLDFDYSGYDHKRTDLDGKTALCTKAANFAANAGILVFASAGNGGSSGIGAPADSPDVIAVGSVTKNELKSGFSSEGPTADGRIKPDLSAMGTSSTVSYVSGNNTILGTSSGTSFSGPILAGFGTCFWQSKKSLTAKEIKSEMLKLGSQSKNPDNLLGYGIPRLGNVPTVILANEKPNSAANFNVYPNPAINEITIKSKIGIAKFQVKLIDIYGKTISENSEANSNLTKLNLQNLAQGLYFLQITQSAKTETIKLLIK